MTEKRFYYLGVVLTCGLFLNAAALLVPFLRGAPAYADGQAKPAAVYLCDRDGHPITVFNPIGLGGKPTEYYSIGMASLPTQPIPVALYLKDRVTGEVNPLSNPLPVTLYRPNTPFNPPAPVEVPFPVRQH